MLVYALITAVTTFIIFFVIVKLFSNEDYPLRFWVVLLVQAIIIALLFASNNNALHIK